MEASALTQAGVAGIHGRSPLLRLQSDERLIGLIRRGNHHAFEALVARYQSRLLAFCRHMLSSREDAEDVLQEVFAAAFNAILGDEREINVRPWLYRIARNRSLNHLRKATAIGVDSMDVHLAEGGETTADKVHKREEFRLLVADVQHLPETQRTALLLREIDALSYEQIAEAMETTVPSVKSLLVRARVSLAEAGEARMLTCEEVRAEIGEVAEGLRRTSAPVRRHVRTCDRCAAFRRHVRKTNRELALLFPVTPLLFVKKTLLAQLGTTAAAGGGTAAAGAAAGGALQAGMTTLATKAATGLAAAALVTAGAVEVKHVAQRPQAPAAQLAAAAPAAAAAPITAAPAPAPTAVAPEAAARPVAETGRYEKPKPAQAAPAATATATPAATPTAAATPATQYDSATTTLPTSTTGSTTPADGALAPEQPASQPLPATQPDPQPQPAVASSPAPATTPVPAATPTPAPAATPTPAPVATPDPVTTPDSVTTPDPAGAVSP